MAQKIGELYALHEEYNEKYFSGKLSPITLLIKRGESYDGKYTYRAHKDWQPIRTELKRADIIVCEGCWEADTVEETILHEMIHQYQAEILNRAPSHDAIFNSIARKLERLEGMTILR